MPVPSALDFAVAVEVLRGNTGLTERRGAVNLYAADPLTFVRDCFVWPEGERIASYQEDILSGLLEWRRVAVRSPRGGGKTALAAWLILWFSLTRHDFKVIATASIWRQLTHYLWPEVHKWARRIRWDKVGRRPFDWRVELLQTSLKLPGGEAFAAASNDPATIEGAHAAHLLYIFDEAKIIPAAYWDSAEGSFTGGQEALALAISTPGEPTGRFYDIHARRPGFLDWHTIHVTMEDCIAEGRMSREWAEQRRHQWGEESAVYQNQVLGEFAAFESEGIIPLAWVEAANERWYAWRDNGHEDGFTCVGVDVARSGEDMTVLALRHGDAISELRRYSRQETMATTGIVKGILDAHGGYAVVDVIGIGAGVVDRLREQKAKVVAFNASEKAEGKDRSGELGFRNLRSASWWNLREILDPANGQSVALPPDDLLLGDLTSPHWRPTSGGLIEVEDKDAIRKRIGRSTDDGDAVVMAFWESFYQYHPIRNPVVPKAGQRNVVAPSVRDRGRILVGGRR